MDRRFLHQVQPWPSPHKCGPGMDAATAPRTWLSLALGPAERVKLTLRRFGLERAGTGAATKTPRHGPGRGGAPNDRAIQTARIVRIARAFRGRRKYGNRSRSGRYAKRCAAVLEGESGVLQEAVACTRAFGHERTRAPLHPLTTHRNMAGQRAFDAPRTASIEVRGAIGSGKIDRSLECLLPLRNGPGEAPPLAPEVATDDERQNDDARDPPGQRPGRTRAAHTEGGFQLSMKLFSCFERLG